MYLFFIGCGSSVVFGFPVSYVDADVASLVSSVRGTIVVPCSFALSGMFRVVFVLGTVTFFSISSFTSTGEIIFGNRFPLFSRPPFMEVASSQPSRTRCACASDTESSSHHGHGARVSWGSLCMSSPKGGRSTRRHSDAAMATLVALPNVDGPSGEPIRLINVYAHFPYWFQAGFIPHNEQEVSCVDDLRRVAPKVSASHG